MSMIIEWFQGLFGYLGSLHWYIPLYWLLGAYLVCWPLAWLLSLALIPIQRGKAVEQSVHLAWAIVFAIHLMLFLFWGSDNVPLAYYNFHDKGTSFDTWGIVLGVLWVAPYLLMAGLDLFFALHLIRTPKSANTFNIARRIQANVS